MPLPFARRGDVFGDHAVASAMIDRIVHHAEVLTLKGNSYRLKDTKLTVPSEKTENKANYATNNVAHNAVAENGPLFSHR